MRSLELPKGTDSPPLSGVAKAELKGAHTLHVFDDVTFPNGIAGNRQWMEVNSDATVRVLRALNEGVAAWHAQPDVVQRVLEAEGSANGPEQAKEVYDGSVRLFSKQLEPLTEADAREVLEIARQSGVADADPSKASSVSDPSYLQRALQAGS